VLGAAAAELQLIPRCTRKQRQQQECENAEPEACLTARVTQGSCELSNLSDKSQAHNSLSAGG